MEEDDKDFCGYSLIDVDVEDESNEIRLALRGKNFPRIFQVKNTKKNIERTSSVIADSITKDKIEEAISKVSCVEFSKNFL